MKKKLLFLFILPLIGFSQSINVENFNGLTIGNLVGQGSWLTFVDPGTGTSTNISEASLQVTANGDASSNGFTLTGPNGDGGGVFAWNDGFPAAWTARTVGNDILEIEFSVNPGGTGSPTQNDFGVYVYNADYSKVLAGLTIDASTNVISLVAYSHPSGEPLAGTFRYPLAATPGQIVPSNTFSRYGFSYNTVTGEILIDGDGISGPLALSTNVTPDTPAEVDFFAFSGSTETTPNGASSTMSFDDFSVKATATNTLLNVEDFIQNTIGLYPNPAKESITLSSQNSIDSVKVFNNLGQVVLEKNSGFNQETTFDISSLKAGVYIMNIKAEDGKSETKKFIKK